MVYLSCCLKERLRFNIPDSSANFGNDDVWTVAVYIRLRHRQHAGLNLISDVRNDLHRVFELFAASFLRDHSRIDLTGGDIRLSIEIAVAETLVVAEIQVGFCTVFSDEHFAVLEGVHPTRIDVEIGVEFLHGDGQTPGRQKLPQACRSVGRAFKHNSGKF